MKAITDSQLAEWNDTFKPGHPCMLRDDKGVTVETRTRSIAWRLGSGHVVVMVNGFPGGWSIDRIRMMEQHPHPSQGEKGEG